MNCTKCNSDNPEGITYCGQCGEKIEKICPKCNSVNPPQFKFCGQCGNDLTLASEPLRKELSSDEKLEKIRKYFPQGIMEKILSQGVNIEGERRHVTVLFADISGFTPMSEMMDPEEVTGIMNRCFSMIGECIKKHGGTIDKFMGDCVMALFGAPIALEDAPQRAIRSAIMIHREMTQFNDRLTQEKENIKPLRMRIGIHTGPVVAGMVGSDGKHDFTVMGDTVNLASRMQGLAEPGTTYVTEDTFRLTEGIFRFEALGEKKIKGKEKPSCVYQVIAPSTRRTRFDVSAERGLTPFVGRQRELELLFDGFERSKEGRGQAISIIAEAGIGKSRLLYEFHKTVTNEDVIFMEGKCLSYGKGAPYHPIIDILKANFDIREDEDDNSIREKVTNGLNILHIDASSILPYILELLSVKDSGIDKIPMSPEAKKDRIIESIKKIVLKGSEIRPLIIAIEDLHWIDKSSEDALKELLNSISGSKVFLIFTYRPEFVHTWGSRSYHSQVTINRLSNRESLVMVSCLLKTEDINKELEDLILEKTEGIPFFIEEFIKSLKDLKIIECRNGSFRITKDLKTVTIPSTIHDVIMARVDALPEGARDLLRTGSVIEREFSHDLILKATGLDEKTLLSQLSILKDAELLYERGIYPDSIYIFKHALTREVIYDAILTKMKKQLHNRIADVIEEIHRNNLDEYYGTLADHYLTADNHAKGADYARLASKRAEKKVSLNDAINYAKKRVDAVERLPQGTDMEKTLIDARAALGNYYTQMSYAPQAKETVEPILPLALKHNNKRRLAQIYSIFGTYYSVCEEDFPTALTYFDKALKLAEEVNDILAIWTASHWMGHAYADNCEFDKALQCLNRSLEINQFVNILWGMACMKSCIAMNVYCRQGKAGLAYETSLEGVRLAEESGDVFSKADTYTGYGNSCYTKGLLGEAEVYLRKSIALAETIGWTILSAFANFVLGEMLFTNGQYEESQIFYRKCITQMEQSGWYPSLEDLVKIAVARIDVINGGKKVDFEELRTYVHDNKMKMFEGWVRYDLTHALMLSGESGMDEAEIWIKEAIVADTKNGMMWHLARDHALYADFFKKKGDTARAKEQLIRAIDIFRECGADGWETRTEKVLAAIC